MKRIFFIIISLVVILYSCDKVDSPYIEKSGGDDGSDTSATFVQNVLVEDYTAHTCVNCPRAARVLDDLHATYGHKIIPLAIHVSSLAKPYNPPFDADFRTTVGNELDTEFGLSASGLPKGLINRAEYNGNVKVPDGEWQTAVSIQLAKEPLYGIVIKSDIDTTNKKISVDVDLHVLRDTTQNLMLCVYLVENKIIGGQLDGEVPGDHIVQDYTFMHVLRTSLNSTWGEEVASASTPISKDDIINKKFDDFSYDAAWVAKNLNVVAFVYDNDTKEVFQAELSEIEIE